jgi:hypothetical protein
MDQEAPRCSSIRFANIAWSAIVTPATICDHIEPHKGDVTKFWTGKLQSLCLDCHLVTKRQIEGYGYRLDTGFDGWPLDPCYTGKV